MVTFPVSSVRLAAEPLPSLNRQLALRSLLHSPVEQLDPSTTPLPLLCHDLRDGTTHKLRLVAGLFGVGQHASSGALQPEFGWAVIHEPQTTP